jgi:hypothetical protein
VKDSTKAYIIETGDALAIVFCAAISKAAQGFSADGTALLWERIVRGMHHARRQTRTEVQLTRPVMVTGMVGEPTLVTSAEQAVRILGSEAEALAVQFAKDLLPHGVWLLPHPDLT